MWSPLLLLLAAQDMSGRVLAAAAAPAPAGNPGEVRLRITTTQNLVMVFGEIWAYDDQGTLLQPTGGSADPPLKPSNPVGNFYDGNGNTWIEGTSGVAGQWVELTYAAAPGISRFEIKNHPWGTQFNLGATVTVTDEWGSVLIARTLPSSNWDLFHSETTTTTGTRTLSTSSRTSSTLTTQTTRTSSTLSTQALTTSTSSASLTRTLTTRTLTSSASATKTFTSADATTPYTMTPTTMTVTLPPTAPHALLTTSMMVAATTMPGKTTSLEGTATATDSFTSITALAMATSRSTTWSNTLLSMTGSPRPTSTSSVPAVAATTMPSIGRTTSLEGTATAPDSFTSITALAMTTGRSTTWFSTPLSMTGSPGPASTSSVPAVPRGLPKRCDAERDLLVQCVRSSTVIEDCLAIFNAVKRCEADFNRVDEVDSFLDRVADFVKQSAQTLVNSSGNITVRAEGGGVLFASFLQDFAQGDDGVKIVETSPVEIGLPSAFVRMLLKSQIADDELIMSVFVVDSNRTRELDCLSAVALDISYLKSGENVAVSGLKEPVKITFPVPKNNSAVTCAYWDKAAGEWSQKGVSISAESTPDGNLVCETTHFSLFGAILRGMLKTLVCANFDIFADGNVRQVLEGGWQATLGARVLFSILAGLALLFASAAALDRARGQKYSWNDEFFLVSAEPRPVPAPGDDAPSTPPPTESAITKTKMLACNFCAAALSCCLGDSLREGLDDILSNWLEYFSELRQLLEAFCSALASIIEEVPALSFAALLRVVKNTSARAAERLLLTNARRRAAATLGISADLLEFVTGDKDLAVFITDRRVAQTSSSAPSPERATSWLKDTDQSAAWCHLLDEVNEALLHKTRHHSKCEALGGICHDLVFHSPLGQILAIDIHRTSKQKVALLATELLGSLVLVAVFFEGGGMVRRKAQRGGAQLCGDGDGESFGMRIGRFAVIATASLFVAGLPVVFLESLLTKGFKTIDGVRGSEVWRRQLKAWRAQEALFWLAVLLYVLACSLYLTVFIANVDPNDHWDFSFAGALGLLEDLVAIPVIMAAAIPLAGRGWLAMHAQATGITHNEVVRNARINLFRGTNLMLPRELV